MIRSFEIALAWMASAGDLLAAVCTNADVILATIPTTDDGVPLSNGERCIQTAECPEGKFCEKRECGDGPGRCHSYPTLCPSDAAPVCGCDGVTYFNDVIRRVAGMASAAEGECKSGAMECRGVPPWRILLASRGGFDRCGPGEHSRCWQLPTTCPDDAGPDQWDPCGPPAPGLQCLDICTAIRVEKPHFRQTPCE